MKKMCVCLSAFLVLAFAANALALQSETKPLVTISIAGYENLVNKLNFIGRLGGNPQLGQALEMTLQMMTQGQGTAGLDIKRPWGFVVQSDESRPFSFFGFLPVGNLKQLMDTAMLNPAVAQSIKLNNGVYEIAASGQTIFVQQQGTWAIIADKRESLAAAPSDPAKLLGEMPKNYDLAVCLSMKNLPASYREQFLAQLQAGARAGMRQGLNESDEQFALRTNASKRMLEQMTTLVNELDEMVLGWKIDAEKNTTYLDLSMTAQAGSKLAAQFAETKPGKTNFAGFFAPEAALAANWAGVSSETDAAQAKESLTFFREKLRNNLQSQNLDEEEARVLNRFLDEVFDVLIKTIESRKSDVGMALYLEPGALNFIAGGMIVDAPRLEKVLREMVEILRQRNPDEAAAIHLDAESSEGVNYHVLSLPTPQEELKPFFGDTMDVVIGFAPDKLLLGVGPKAVEKLKAALTASKAQADKEIPPMRMMLSARKFAKFFAEIGNDPQVQARVAKIASMLEAAGEKDHVLITSTMIPRGARVRLELEEGLLRTLASSLSQLPLMMGPMGVPQAPQQRIGR